MRTAATAVDEPEPRLSETITRGRRNERVRIKLCLHLNMAYESLWGGEPNWNVVAAGLRADYDARFTASGNSSNSKAA